MTGRRQNGVELRDTGDLPGCAGQFRGPAVVAGTAAGYAGEFLSAWRGHGHCPVVGVNRFGLEYQGICGHWVSVHPEIFFPCRAWRVTTHSDKPHADADAVWPIATMGGSSALLAVLVALCLGFAPVVAAGVHLVGEYRRMQGSWRRFERTLRGRVFSVSPPGTFVRDFLGAPGDHRHPVLPGNPAATAGWSGGRPPGGPGPAILRPRLMAAE